ncbi:uncharacterized protein LOC133297988 [Gastrolobium bilobum]|uniref:uncharacterized protein LOC133297988 n=1 Tax=Gastrolobium bilobum TaxID=150636 RepID=UPI002AAF35CA|nr:uncharacterized protein LOC133297988 [Gastrolobium bilobum]
MGNCTSCSYVSNSIAVSIGFLKKRGKGTKTAMLVDTGGNIREIKLPVKSAELMIEEIGHVITPVDELWRTRRISALRADEELVAGKVYLLVPASRVHSKASEFEMAIAEKENGQRKRPSGNNTAKVSPSPASRLRESDEENEVAIFTVCRKRGNQGRWNPVLEPISEFS